MALFGYSEEELQAQIARQMREVIEDFEREAKTLLLQRNRAKEALEMVSEALGKAEPGVHCLQSIMLALETARRHAPIEVPDSGVRLDLEYRGAWHKAIRKSLGLDEEVEGGWSDFIPTEETSRAPRGEYDWIYDLLGRWSGWCQAGGPPADLEREQGMLLAETEAAIRGRKKQ